MPSRLRLPSSVWRRQGGWLAHRGGGKRAIKLTLNAGVDDQTSLYNLFTAAGSPAVPVIVILSNAAVLQAGFTTGTGWKGGSFLKVINTGSIFGTGGAGGNGGDGSGAGGNAGSVGGDAVTLLYDLTIDNGSGSIYSGGGGGGGGGGANSTGTGTGGGGGGGAQGYNVPAGGTGGAGLGAAGHNGTAGIPSAAGSGGTGSGYVGPPPLNAGDAGGGATWGLAGSDGGAATVGSSLGAGGSGGAAGKAVALNGHTVTFLAGNDGPAGTHVKGAIA